MKNKVLIFLLLSFWITILPQESYSADGSCYAVFFGAKDEIRHRVLRDRFLFIKNYQGQSGYLRFTESLQKTVGMDYVFEVISKLLNEKERKELGWQQFKGTVSEYRELRGKILDVGGELRLEYRGMEGYALFSERHFVGSMQKAYVNTSTILDKKRFQELGWQQFKGTVSEYRELRGKILDVGGELRLEYRGMEGYALFSERHFVGSMQKAYVNTSTILDKKRFQELGWQVFHGTVSEYRELRGKILDVGGELRLEYRGMEGYALFSEQHFVGSMQKAYVNTSTILDKKRFQELGWQQFQGTVSEYRELRGKILDVGGELRLEYRGMEGYALFSEQHFVGSMQKAYMNTSTILDKKRFQELGWQQFKGTVSEYRELRGKILDVGGELRLEYKGMEGYALFSEQHFVGSMQKAYINISTVLGGFRAIRELGLGWKQFPGSASQFHALKDLFDRYTVEQLKGSKGQGQVAGEVFDGDRRKTYDSVSILREELLGNRKAFNELKWTRASQ